MDPTVRSLRELDNGGVVGSIDLTREVNPAVQIDPHPTVVPYLFLWTSERLSLREGQSKLKPCYPKPGKRVLTEALSFWFVLPRRRTTLR